jgi:putative flippase GtrA
MIRYGISGAVVACLYLGGPIAVNAAFDWPLQAMIPVAYVLAAMLHFTLQRIFVFRHIEQFALSTRTQAARFVSVGAVQYPTTALGTLLLPAILGVPDRVAFLAISMTFSLCFFLFIRSRVFHAAAPGHLLEKAIAE